MFRAPGISLLLGDRLRRPWARRRRKGGRRHATPWLRCCGCARHLSLSLLRGRHAAHGDTHAPCKYRVLEKVPVRGVRVSTRVAAAGDTHRHRRRAGPPSRRRRDVPRHPGPHALHLAPVSVLNVVKLRQRLLKRQRRRGERRRRAGRPWRLGLLAPLPPLQLWPPSPRRGRPHAQAVARGPSPHDAHATGTQAAPTPATRARPSGGSRLRFGLLAAPARGGPAVWSVPVQV